MNDGRWAFAEFTEIYAMQDDFRQLVEVEFNKMLDSYLARPDAVSRAGQA